jgi:phosphatidylinositol alpha-1,6-mannosyltransferase
MPDADRDLNILLVTRNFPPLTGGMERLMQNFAEGISEYANLTIIGPRGCAAYCPKGTEVYEAPASLAPFVLFSTWHALIACRKTRFDIMVGGSGLAAPVLRLMRLLFGTKTALFIHGLDIVVDNLIYQKLFIPAIRSADLVIANSRNTRELARKRGIASDQLVVINPGTDLPDHGAIESRERFCKRHQIPYEKIILFVGRMTRRKGLSHFIERSLPDILTALPQSGLLVVGDNPNQSLNKQGEQQEVLETVARLGLHEKVRFLGQVNEADLIAAYAAADVQVFPLIDLPGDVEGFGMIAIEAAACGTPTIAFATGGVADAISDDNGRLVEIERYDQLSKALIDTLTAQSPDSIECRQHAERFSWPIFHSKVRAGLIDLVKPPREFEE